MEAADTITLPPARSPPPAEVETTFDDLAAAMRDVLADEDPLPQPAKHKSTAGTSFVLLESDTLPPRVAASCAGAGRRQSQCKAVKAKAEVERVQAAVRAMVEGQLALGHRRPPTPDALDVLPELPQARSLPAKVALLDTALRLGHGPTITRAALQLRRTLAAPLFWKYMRGRPAAAAHYIHYIRQRGSPTELLDCYESMGTAAYRRRALLLRWRFGLLSERDVNVENSHHFDPFRGSPAADFVSDQAACAQGVVAARFGRELKEANSYVLLDNTDAEPPASPKSALCPPPADDAPLTVFRELLTSIARPPSTADALVEALSLHPAAVAWATARVLIEQRDWEQLLTLLRSREWRGRVWPKKIALQLAAVLEALGATAAPQDAHTRRTHRQGRAALLELVEHIMAAAAESPALLADAFEAAALCGFPEVALAHLETARRKMDADMILACAERVKSWTLAPHSQQFPQAWANRALFHKHLQASLQAIEQTTPTTLWANWLLQANFPVSFHWLTRRADADADTHGAAPTLGDALNDASRALVVPRQMVSRGVGHALLNIAGTLRR